MRWQKAARIGLAAAGLSGAAAIYFLAKDRPAPVAAEQPTVVDPKATVELGPGTTQRFAAGSEVVRYSFDSMRGYEDRDVLIKAYALFEKDGLEVWTDELEQRKSGTGPTQAERFSSLKGNVRVRGSDGLELLTDSAQYDPANGGTLIMPGKVTFSKGRISGTGDGASYIRAQELFRLNENADITVKPDEKGVGGAHARSRSVTLARLEHFARLEEKATIQRQTETLSADSATIYFTEDEKQLRLVDLRGQAKVTPVAGTAGPPEMRADTISLALHPTGDTLQRSTLAGNAELGLVDATGRRSITAAWIDATTAPDGRTLTALDARDRVVVDLPAAGETPARRIESATLNATGEPQKGLTQARFEGAPQGAPVRFTERREPGAQSASRDGTSRRLDLSLAGGLEAIQDADFRERVVFTDGTTRATAERAIYKVATGRLELRTVDTRVPHVERTDLVIDAQTINLEIDADRLDAAGAVRTLSKSAGRGKTRRAGLFDDAQDVIGAAASLEYSGKTGIATYKGAAGSPASLTQGASRVAGQELIVDEKKGNLTARGSVDSTMEIDDRPAESSGTPPSTTPARMMHRMTADELVYDDAARRATYTGKLAKLTRPDGSTEAQEIVILLASEGRTLKELHARRDAFAKMDENSEATGDELLYDAESELYTLIGKPARAKFPDEDRKGCWLSTGQVIRFKRNGTQPDSDERTRSESIDCRKSIR